MSSRYQFSMRAMFVVVTVICAEIGLWRFLGKCISEREKNGEDHMLLFIIFIGVLATLIVTRRPLGGTLAGFIVGITFANSVKLIYVAGSCLGY
jgi:dolichol kinase